MNVLSVSGISKSTNNGFLLSEVSFSLQKQQKIAIAGETGSGKSTLLKIIAGMIQADSGEVLYEGQRVKGPDEKLIPGHPHIAYLSQYYELRNHYRVEELMEMALKVPEAEAAALFDLCRVDHLLKRKTSDLSGGEKQRIALAKVLITKPSLLILDEPYSNLDLIHKSILKGVLKDIGDHLQLSCLLASHDPLDTLSWADEMLVLQHGCLIQQGPPRLIYEQPLNEYVAGLLGRYTLIPADKTAAFEQLTGSPSTGKDLILRPESIRISTEPGIGTTATVSELRFMGSYYEVDLITDGLKILAMSLDHHLAPGDIVGISYTR